MTTLKECYDRLNFWINKKLGIWYSFEDLDSITHAAQLSVFKDYQGKYATSQEIKDALAPFVVRYSFGYSDTLNGLVQIPSNLNYLNLLSLSINYDISARSITREIGINLFNEDERPDALNDPIDVVTSSAPKGEQVGVGVFQLYPKVQYRGLAVFLRTPAKPFFSYTLISGRVVAYNAGASTQLEWADTQINEILMKVLISVGVNLTSPELVEFAQAKSQTNYTGENNF